MLASSAVVILAFIVTKSTSVGERLLNHHLARKVEALRHEHDEKIEALRADLGHLQDRGRRANELEFDAASKIWQAFVAAHMKTRQAVIDYLTIPDLDRLSTGDLETFLESTDFSTPQRKQVLEANEKVRTFSKINRLRIINIAGASIYEGRLLLTTNSVFLPSAFSMAFKQAFDTLHGAQVEQYIDFQRGRSHSYEKGNDLIGPGGDALLARLETLTRTTLRRD